MKINNQHFVVTSLLGAVLLIVFLGLLWRDTGIISPDRADEKLRLLTDGSTEEVSLRQAQNAFTVIFFTDGYVQKAESEKHILALKTTLEELEPFKSMKDKIQIKEFTSSGKCKVAVKLEKKVLACDPKLISSFEDLGFNRFKLVVVSPEEFESASDYSYGKNSVIKISAFQGMLTDKEFYPWLGILFAQELGHSLGLQYEYMNSKPSDFDLGTKKNSMQSPNCVSDIASARRLWSTYNNVAYLTGCGDKDTNIFPEKETLMSDFPVRGVYGAVSEEYLKRVVECFYGNLETQVCIDFKKSYPRFWEE